MYWRGQSWQFGRCTHVPHQVFINVKLSTNCTNPDSLSWDRKKRIVQYNDQRFTSQLPSNQLWLINSPLRSIVLETKIKTPPPTPPLDPTNAGRYALEFQLQSLGFGQEEENNLNRSVGWPMCSKVQIMQNPTLKSKKKMQDAVRSGS